MHASLPPPSCTTCQADDGSHECERTNVCMNDTRHICVIYVSPAPQVLARRGHLITAASHPRQPAQDIARRRSRVPHQRSLAPERPATVKSHESPVPSALFESRASDAARCLSASPPGPAMGTRWTRPSQDDVVASVETASFSSRLCRPEGGCFRPESAARTTIRSGQSARTSQGNT